MKTIEIKTISDHEIYVQARDHLYKEELSKFKRLKNSPELSQEERKILKAREHIHRQEWKQCMDILTNMGRLKSEYLHAEMYALKAYLHSIQAEPEESLWANSRALFYYELCQDDEGLFRTHYNRAVSLESFKQYRLMNYHYNEARKYAKDPHQISHILKAESFIHCLLKQEDAAKEKIEEALNLIPKLEKTHADNLKTVASEIYIKVGNFQKAKNLLKEVIASKINPERARVLAELRMLEVIEDGGKMKTPPETVSKNYFWHLKWKILQNLLEGEVVQAKIFWSELSASFPKLYGKDFEIFDPFERETAFGILLEKSYQLKPSRGQMPKSLSKGELLLWYLENSPVPLRKEDLIEKIWDCEYNPKFDARFYKLIQRVKKEKPIENEGGVYFLKKVLKSA